VVALSVCVSAGVRIGAMVIGDRRGVVRPGDPGLLGWSVRVGWLAGCSQDAWPVGTASPCASTHRPGAWPP